MSKQNKQKIFWQGKYNDMSEGRIMEALEEERFSPIKITNGSGYRYHEHSHPEEKLMVILEGEMDVITKEKTYSCKPGDKLILPGNLVHAAIVGEDGCTFFWAQR